MVRDTRLEVCAGQLPESRVWAVGADRTVKWKVIAEGKSEGWGLRGQEETWFPLRSTLFCDVCLCLNFPSKNPFGK